MSNKRVKNINIETKVLFKNRFTCCICHDDSKEVNIHHIDGNHNNTVEENLAVLCLEHASKADASLKRGKLGAGRKLTSQIVKQFKKIWEDRVAAEFRVQKKNLPVQKRKQLEILYEFEISKIKNEILSLPETTKKTIKQKLNFLTQLLFEEFITGVPMRKLILKAFSDTAIQSAGQEYLSIPLLSSLKDLHLHLVGPEEVPIRQDDKRALLKTLSILETIGVYGASITDSLSVLKKSCKTIFELNEVATWYKFNSFIEKSKKALLRIRKECNNYDAPNLRKDRKQRKIKNRIEAVNQFLRFI